MIDPNNPIRNIRFTPLSILPTQEERSSRQLSGHQRLRWAILEEAIGCLQQHSTLNHSNSGREISVSRKRLGKEAEDWLLSDDTSYLFAFVNICDALGIDPGYLRKGLKLV